MYRPAYLTQDPAWFFPRILVGAGKTLTKSFAKKYNITHVINCADAKETPAWFRETHPTKIAVLNAIDTLDTKILEWYPGFDEAMISFLRSKNSGTIFVHCQCGINRSASLAAAYVINNYNVDWIQLYKMVKRQRPCVFTNPSFRNQLDRLFEEIQKRDGCLSVTKEPSVIRHTAVATRHA